MSARDAAPASPELGVLLMAYGAPASLEAVGEYFTHIRGGRRPPQERIDELVERYRRVGGVDALRRVTAAQAAALQARLEADGGAPVRVFTGMRHSPPFIADRAAEIASSGVRRLLGMVLAPHYSAMSVGRYHAILKEALAARPSAPELVLVDDYHEDPGYIAAAVEALRETLGSLAGSGGKPPHVIFTAHSLPARIRDDGDPYPDHVEATARLVARAADVQDWEVAWQSASPTGEPWLGPDFIERIREAARAGAADVVIAPVGFVSDHLEILYDIDVLASEAARAAGCRLARTPSMNTRPAFIAALASIVRRRLGGSPA